MHKNATEMERAAKVVFYEWYQLLWAVKKRSEYWNAAAGTGGGDSAQDALIEVVLLHARCLVEFYVKRRVDLPRNFLTTIFAEDFFDELDHWQRPAFKYLEDPQTKDRLNRALSHLAYDRLDYEDTGKDWDIPAVVSDLENAWTHFRDALPEDRQAWFPPKIYFGV